MGARVHFVFKQDDSGNNVTLYSHWGETTWREDLAMALAKATPRWDDPTYATRIVVSQLIGNNWNSETGYGLYVTNDTSEFWDLVVEVNFVDQTVLDNGHRHSFHSFVEYQQEIKEYHNA